MAWGRTWNRITNELSPLETAVVTLTKHTCLTHITRAIYLISNWAKRATTVCRCGDERRTPRLCTTTKIGKLAS